MAREFSNQGIESDFLNLLTDSENSAGSRGAITSCGWLLSFGSEQGTCQQRLASEFEPVTSLCPTSS